MYWLSKCLFCKNFVYRLNDNRVKCSVCLKKMSINKINKIITLINAYIENISANQCSKSLNISYVSVSNYYEEFRILSAKISEEEYLAKKDTFCEYEEYYYLENSKRKKEECIFDAYNFLTFDYSKHIYTLLMPSLSPYKEQYIHDGIEGTFINDFNKFKRNNKIIKVTKYHNNIVKFWNYFEEYILHYKGVSSEYFIYYLKEYEFKYNHTKDKSIELLIEYYFKG